MGLQTQFNKFHKKINLTRQDQAYKNAREKDDSILEKIRESFKKEGHPIISDFIQGSLKTCTAIKSVDGDFDIDRAIVIDAEKAPDNPVDVKLIVLDVLEARGFKNATIKKPCVTADYASLNLHIDFPVYTKDGDKYKLAIGRKNSTSENRKWDNSDPNGLQEWVNDDRYHQKKWDVLTDVEFKQFRRVVQYLKRWRDEQYTSSSERKKVYSIGLTVMVKKSFCPSADDEGTPNDLLAIKDTVLCILSQSEFFIDLGDDKYDLIVKLPKSPHRDIFNDHGSTVATKLRNKFSTLTKKIIEVEIEKDLKKQCEILQKQFGVDFPIPEIDGGSSKAIYATSGVSSSSQGA